MAPRDDVVVCPLCGQTRPAETYGAHPNGRACKDEQERIALYARGFVCTDMHPQAANYATWLNDCGITWAEGPKGRRVGKQVGRRVWAAPWVAILALIYARGQRVLPVTQFARACVADAGLGQALVAAHALGGTSGANGLIDGWYKRAGE